MNKNAIRRSLANGVAFIALIGATAAHAEATRYAFDIQAQPLSSAIRAVGVQSGMNLVFDPSSASNRTAPAVRGFMTAEEAVAKLVSGTGLSFHPIDQRSALIERVSMNVSQAPDREPTYSAPIQLAQNSQGPVTMASSPAPVSAAVVEEVVVTGSRTALNGNDQPTPVTIVTTAELASNTPSNIPDALNKLPIFQGSASSATTGNATTNSSGNFLNLRGFGIIRTLILQDGRRVPATAANGTVDTNTIPQMLVKQVDVVTGGASAVYGSDAVTGVVNFVLDSKFNGVKINAQGGVSSRNDDGSYKFGIAGGRGLLDGRAHVEGSYEYYNSAGIDDRRRRPETADPQCVQGSGTVAVPFKVYTSCRNSNQSYGGKIRTGPLAEMTFSSNGVLTPFVHGGATGTAGTESGGDGTYAANTSIASYLRNTQLFGRADYDLTDNLRTYVQITGTRSINGQTAQYPTINPNVFWAFNPYLTPAQQALASRPGATIVNGQPTFTMGKLFTNNELSWLKAFTTNVNVTAGLRGQLTEDLTWDAYYTKSRSTQRVVYDGNNNNALQYAALDAVRDPRTGEIVCSVTLTNPGLYPGCRPVNPFGPTASDPNLVSYYRKITQYTLENTMDDVGANIAGRIFDTWAGPVRAALSGEVRKVKLTNVSNADPTQKLDCTGLRFNCVSNSVVWGGNVTANMAASQTISEGAVEVSVPLLVDAPLAKSLEVNGAVRYAHYSVSGNATTWKLGATWAMNDDLSFRGTRSRDIRAPTLFDLYQPVSQNQSGFADQHTGVNTTLPAKTFGNVDLKPEVADTTTIGMVYRPHFLPRFSVAIDYYKIHLDDAISLVSGLTALTQTICENSGGTAPVCSLYVRPLPFSNRTAANFPTLVLAQPQNIAQTATSGVDIELNYNFMLDDLSPSLSGRLSTRVLAAYQPVNKAMQFPDRPYIQNAGYAKQKISLQGSYSNGPFTVGGQVRWRGKVVANADPSVIFIGPNLGSHTIADLNGSYKFKAWGKNLETFVSVQNVFDKLQPRYSSPQPGTPGDDNIGRYYTGGVRVSF